MVSALKLTPQQLRTWQFDSAANPSPYLTQLEFVFEGGVELNDIRAAFTTLLEEAPQLRLCLQSHPGSSDQVIKTVLEVEPFLDAMLFDSKGDDSAVRARCVLPSYVADAGMVEPMAKALAAILAGEPQPETPPFGLVADWKHDLFTSDQAAIANAAWRERVAALAEIIALSSGALSTGASFQVASLKGHVNKDVWSYCRARDTDASDEEAGAVWLALWSQYVAARTKLKQLPVGVNLSGRTEPELEQVLGPLAVVAPVNVHAQAGQSLDEAVIEASMALFEAHAWQDSFAWDLYVPAEKSPEQTFAPFILDLGNKATGRTSWKGGHVSVHVGQSVLEPFVFRLRVGAGSIFLDYDAAQIDLQSAEWFLEGFCQFAEAAAATPSKAFTCFGKLGASETQWLLSKWQASPTIKAKPLLGLFGEQVRKTPDSVALSDTDGKTVSYAALDAWSDRVASVLQAHGCGPETFVAACLQPSSARAAVALGILKCGAVWVPLDPADPVKRLQKLLQTCEPAALVSDVADVQQALSGLENCALVSPYVETDASSYRVTASHPEALAYAVFTSGSTGEPKCVAVSIAALDHQISWAINALGMNNNIRFLARTAPGFDAAIWELLAPLCSGGTLIFPSVEARDDIGQLANDIKRSEANTIQLVPSLLRVMLKSAPDCLDQLSTVFCGGEVLPAHLAQEAMARGVQLINLFGPAECCVQVSAQKLEREALPDAQRACSVGHVMEGVGVRLLDPATGVPVSVGLSGVMDLAGVCLARGYVGAPAATAESFLPHEGEKSFGQRLYRTGDIAILDTQGCLEIIGRDDAQVKIRGVRVEPAEVAAVLRATPGVQDAEVVLDRNDPLAPVLIAIVALSGEQDDKALSNIRKFLAERLPNALVPARFVPVPDIPKLSNGKVDRQALRKLAGRLPHLDPETRTEEVLAQVWQSVLQLDKVGRHDNFFDLGGHSILMLRMLGKLRASFGVEVPLSLIQECSNLEVLAAEIDLLVATHAEAQGVCHD